VPKKNNTLETSLTTIMPFAQRERVLPNIAKYPLLSLLSFFSILFLCGWQIVHHYCAFSCLWRHARKNMVNNGLESNMLLNDFNINSMDNITIIQ